MEQVLAYVLMVLALPLIVLAYRRDRTERARAAAAAATQHVALDKHPVAVHAGLAVRTAEFVSRGVLRVDLDRPNAPVGFDIRNPVLAGIPSSDELVGARLMTAVQLSPGSIRFAFQTPAGRPLIVTGTTVSWAPITAAR